MFLEGVTCPLFHPQFLDHYEWALVVLLSWIDFCSVLHDVIVLGELSGKIKLWQSLSHYRWPILFQAKTKMEVLVEQQGAESSVFFLYWEVSDSQGTGHLKVIVEAVAKFAAWGFKSISSEILDRQLYQENFFLIAWSNETSSTEKVMHLCSDLPMMVYFFFFFWQRHMSNFNLWKSHKQ